MIRAALLCLLLSSCATLDQPSRCLVSPGLFVACSRVLAV
jgi:hypothetical protein